MTNEERAAIESADQGVQRAAFDLTIDTAEDGGDGRRIVKGVANTFGVMRSGRIIHPKAADEWLKAGGGRVPLLAQHGQIAGGFATLGAATLTVSGGKLRFVAELGQGLPLADEAWKLISQNLLTAVSLGWRGLQARWVREDDADLDADLKREMKRAGVKEAYAFLKVEPVELSLVDVPDDAGALVGAGRGAALNGGAAIDPEGASEGIRSRIESLERQLAALTERAAAATPFGIEAAAVERAVSSRLESFLAEFQISAVNAIRQSEDLQAAAVDAYDAAGRDADAELADGVAELAAIGDEYLGGRERRTAADLATLRGRIATVGAGEPGRQGRLPHPTGGVR